MKNLITILTLALVAVVAFAPAAQAAPTAKILFSVDGDPTLYPIVNVNSGDYLNVHVALSGFDAAVNALEYKLNLLSGMGVTGHTYPFANPIDLMSGPSLSASHYFGFGECFPVIQESGNTPDNFVVHSVRVYIMGHFDRSAVTLTAAEGLGSVSSSFPKYVTCDGQEHDIYTVNYGFVTSSTVDNADESFGAIKALY